MVCFNFRTLAAVVAVVLPFIGAAPTAPVSRAGTVIADNYVVMLKSDVSAEQLEAHKSWTESIHNNRLSRRDDASLQGTKFTYNFHNIKGYSGSFSQETINAIKASPEVAYVEEDKVVTANTFVNQTNVPSWGLARISQKTLGGLTTYYYDDSAGEGITAYVIDTGILTTHVEFEGRATFGFTAFSGLTGDGFGHGTHVSGTIAGATYGIAKKAKLIAVKVLDNSGSGSVSTVVAGINWAANDAATKGIAKKSVANMSLGGGFSQAINDAVTAAVAAGTTYAVAAGNDYRDDAKFYSPASVPTAITVGATDNTDAITDFSNIGALVDVFAPGLSITSAWIGSNTANNTISGTSMSTPHVVGVAAYLIAFEGLSSPADVAARIVALSSESVEGVPSGTTDDLLYNGSGH